MDSTCGGQGGRGISTEDQCNALDGRLHNETYKVARSVYSVIGEKVSS